MGTQSNRKDMEKIALNNIEKSNENNEIDKDAYDMIRSNLDKEIKQLKNAFPSPAPEVLSSRIGHNNATKEDTAQDDQPTIQNLKPLVS